MCVCVVVLPLLAPAVCVCPVAVEAVDGDEENASPTIPRSELDSMVLGVKVREAVERPEMGSITEGLRQTVASGGR